MIPNPKSQITQSLSFSLAICGLITAEFSSSTRYMKKKILQLIKSKGAAAIAVFWNRNFKYLISSI